MRKLFLFLFAIAPAILIAAPVEPNVAQQVANNFINASQVDSSGVMRMPKKMRSMSRMAAKVTQEQQFFVFNSEDGEGFVIVSADDVARPILGYSTTESFDADNMPENLRWWLNEYNRQISWAQENSITQAEEITQEWQKFLRKKNNAATVVVEPLIKTKWDQLPYYNAKCPIISQVVSKNLLTTTYKSEQAITGCAATALAQVMKYHEWPQIGDGSHKYNSKLAGTLYANFGATEYDWGNMPNQLDENSSQKQINAVATLMSHCGISMDMNYGFADEGGSGIGSLNQVENAVKTYFRYSDATTTIEKSDYTDAQWISKLKSQLDANTPMVYAGIGGGGGHAFVCDGYDDNNCFHFNWGWSGYCDGYYSISALNPGPNGAGSGGTGDYTERQYALINMTPKAQPLNIANLQLESEMSLDQSSIVYGGTTAIYATVKNSGSADFTGDISALVIDTLGNFVTELPIKTNYTLNRNSTLIVGKSIVQNALLVPGRYAIALVYNSEETGYQLVGSEYYTNAAVLDVTLSAPIEKKSDFSITSDCNNELVTGHRIWFTVTFANISSSMFKGYIALALYDPETLELAQLVSRIDFGITGIAANQERTVNFIDTIRLEPKSYLAALIYSSDRTNYTFVGSTYSQNPCMVRVISDPADAQEDSPQDFTLVPGKYVIVANRDKSDDDKWYYMTSDLGTASNKRFQAVTTGVTDIDDVAIKNLESKYIWELEADGSNWKLKNGSQYITWTSGNTANFATTGKSLTFDVADNQVQAHFNDGTNERYLSLNATTNNNYFAFYSGINQITNLYFLPYQEAETPVIPERDCKALPYTEPFTDTQGDFTIQEVSKDAGLGYIWKLDASSNKYGMVAKAMYSNKYYASEGWLISPCLDIPQTGTTTLTFEHAAKFFSNAATEMTLWVSTDYIEGQPNSATWTKLTIPTYPTGTNWNFVSSGDINLTQYAGQSITLAFKYISTNTTAAQWEIKKFSVKHGNTANNIDAVQSDTPTATKIIENGQIYILLPDGRKYNMQGIEVK